MCTGAHRDQKRVSDLLEMELEVRSICEPPDVGARELNQGPLEEQSELFIPEPSFQAQKRGFPEWELNPSRGDQNAKSYAPDHQGEFKIFY